MKQSIILKKVIENKKKYLSGYKLLTDDKAISEYVDAKLSCGGISFETLQQVANDKTLLLSFTCKKKATVLDSNLCK